MKCNSISYILKRSKLLKQLAKSIDNPDNYISIYKQLVDLFSIYKSNRYDEEVILRMLDLYLEKKGLNKISQILNELDKKREIKEDNYVVLELKQNYEEVNRKMTDLQELVLKSVEDIKIIQQKVNNKVRILNTFSNKKEQRKVRSKAVVS